MGLIDDLKELSERIVEAGRGGWESAKDWVERHGTVFKDSVDKALFVADDFVEGVSDWAGDMVTRGKDVIAQGSKVYDVDVRRAVADVGTKMRDAAEDVKRAGGHALEIAEDRLADLENTMNEARRDVRSIGESIAAGRLVGDLVKVNEISAASVDLMDLLREAEDEARRLAEEKAREESVSPPEWAEWYDNLKSVITGKAEPAIAWLKERGVTERNIERVIDLFAVPMPTIGLKDLDLEKYGLSVEESEEYKRGVPTKSDWWELADKYPDFEDNVPRPTSVLLGGAGLFCIEDDVVRAGVGAAAKKLSASSVDDLAKGLSDDAAREVLERVGSKPAEFFDDLARMTPDARGLLYRKLGETSIGRTAFGAIRGMRDKIIAKALPKEKAVSLVIKALKNPVWWVKHAAEVGLVGLGAGMMAAWELTDFGVGALGMAAYSAKAMPNKEAAKERIKEIKEDFDAVDALAEKFDWLPWLGEALKVSRKETLFNIETIEDLIDQNLMAAELHITVNVKARIYVDGMLQVVGTWCNVKVGADTSHDVVASMDGYEDARVHVTDLKGGEERNVPLELVKLEEGEVPKRAVVNVSAGCVGIDGDCGAEIWLFGADTGFITPHTFNLSVTEAGTSYNIVVCKRGYDNRTFTKTLRPDDVWDIKAALVEEWAPPEPGPEGVPENRVAERGTVSVYTKPAGAFITYGGIWHNYPTPTKLELLPGTYHVVIEREGFKPVEDDITIAAGADIRKEYKLTAVPWPELYRVDITSMPEGAKLLINDAFTSKWTPDYIILNPGVFTFSLVKSGYETWSEEVEIP